MRCFNIASLFGLRFANDRVVVLAGTPDRLCPRCHSFSALNRRCGGKYISHCYWAEAAGRFQDDPDIVHKVASSVGFTAARKFGAEFAEVVGVTPAVSCLNQKRKKPAQDDPDSHQSVESCRLTIVGFGLVRVT